jgi:hypothetical protein
LIVESNGKEDAAASKMGRGIFLMPTSVLTIASVTGFAASQKLKSARL